MTSAARTVLPAVTTTAWRFWNRSLRFTRVKLCEFESLDAAYPAVLAGADALGFHIFRHQDIDYKVELFAGIFAHLPTTTNRVLLTDVDLDVLVGQILPRLAFDTIQLYPDWEPEIIGHLRARLSGTHILKVMSARPEENVVDDAAFIARYRDIVDGFLLDSVRVGGSGKTADWDHCKAIIERSPLPVFLAGGLTADNVGEAITRMRPFGVDVETGVSDRIPDGPLIKNLVKCERFLDAVRAADAAAVRTS